MKKSIALVAMCATALSPILTAPAFAADPTPANLSTMNQMCATYVQMNYGSTTESADSTYYEFDVVYESSEGDPVYDQNSRENDDESWVPDTTSMVSYSDLDASQSTSLIRNGKSPNIFADDVWANVVTWSNNSVNYSLLYTVTTTFTYQCDVTENKWTDPVPPTPPSGAIYDWEHNLPQTSTAGNDCDVYDTGGTQARSGALGDRHGNCILESISYTIPGDPGSDGGFTENDIGLVGLFADILEMTDPVRSEPIFTDTMAGPHTYYDQATQGVAVVCISPGPKGGEWREQNGYPDLPTISDKDCSRATFDSLPGGTIPSASLPSL